jgi:aerobic C4-dicarboxylate transport protein
MMIAGAGPACHIQYGVDMNPGAHVVISSKQPLLWWRAIYVQVLIAIALGTLLGWAAPSLGVEVRPLGDLFIRLVRMLLIPIVFATVTVGIAKMSNLKQLGRVGVLTLLYFEIMSSLALIVGLVIANLVRPGAGINADLSHANLGSIASYTKPHVGSSGIDLVLNIVPESIVQAFAQGEMLPVLFFAVMFGIGLSMKGRASKVAIETLDSMLAGLFGVMGIVMRLAPLGAFGAMGFTVGRYGLSSLLQLGQLMACVYLTCAVFIVLVLGGVARASGFSIIRFLHFIRPEIAIVFGTCSSETVLPQLMEKLQRAGCSEPVVGLVMPAGITFNPDGSAIYLSFATLFIAQATNVSLSLSQQLGLLLVLLITSKGSAGVAGSAFIALAATLSSTDVLPVAGLTLLLGVDRFMNEARAVTNTIGNALATVVVAQWEGCLDRAQFARALGGQLVPTEELPVEG